ncbi:MAG: substrate-binding protein [Actinomadura rubrobrunea]|nr:substrate-binding protein [Actinomadura rubrobrunea]
MGDIVVADRVSLACSPTSAFEYIASGGLPRWRLPLHSRLKPGTPVAVPLRLPAALGGQSVEILGRVLSVDPGRRIVIYHDLPWRGRVCISVRRDGPDRSTVSIAVELDEDIVRWARQTLAPTAKTATDHVWRIGLLSSGSGPASVFCVSSRNTATLAVEEINADGGVAGRPLELVTGDDGTHPGLGAAELVRLAYSGCRVVLASVTSEVFTALRPVARRHGVLIVHTPLNEGGAGHELIRLGERPSGQAVAAIPSLMRATGGSRFFLAGNDYCWPRAAHRAVRRVVERQGGTVLAETYAPLGCTDFTSVISAIDRSGTDIVVSTFVGADEVAFEQQMYEAGMRSRVATLAMVLDESTHAFIGPDASEGLWTAFSYFEVLDTAENGAFKARYHARFGTGGPVSSVTEAVYEAVHLVARAAASVGVWDPVRIGERLREGVKYAGPRGLVTSTGKGVRQPLYVAHSHNGILSPIDQVLTKSS